MYVGLMFLCQFQRDEKLCCLKHSECVVGLVLSPEHAIHILRKETTLCWKGKHGSLPLSQSQGNKQTGISEYIFYKGEAFSDALLRGSSKLLFAIRNWN